MACKGFIQFLLKTLNALLMLAGLAMVGYGLYMFFTYNSTSSADDTSSADSPSSSVLTSVENYWIYPVNSLKLEVQRQRQPEEEALGQWKFVTRSGPTLRLNSNIFDNLPTYWFIYLFIAIGAVIFLITCSGCIAAATSNGCCISCYCVFVSLFIIAELAFAGFIYFDKQWEEIIPEDSTGKLEDIKSFIEEHLGILKWVALGILILQAFLVLLSIVLRHMSSRRKPDYDSDEDEYIIPIRQPLISRPPAAVAAGVGGADTPPSASNSHNQRSDAWSTRMREKYGLDSTNFSKRFTTQASTVEEPRSKCSIM